MVASSDLLMVCLSFWDSISMCVTSSVRGLPTPAPNGLLPFTCESSVYTKSLGFHFQLCGLVFSIVVVLCGCTGMGMSV